MESHPAEPPRVLLEFTVRSISIWNEIRALIEKAGFFSGEQAGDRESQDFSARSPLPPLTLFEAVRLGLGVPPPQVGYADVSFWNWRDLRKAWAKVWDILDEEASRIHGSPIKSVAWAFPKSRTASEIMALIDRAESRSQEPESPLPMLRPTSLEMVNNGQISAAIANTLGVIREGLDAAYCDFLPSLIVQNATDEEFLQRLDEYVAERSLDQTRSDQSTYVPRLLVRARFASESQDGAQFRTFVAFLQSLDQANNLSGNSDQALLHRLTRIAPEKGKEIARKVNLVLAR